MTDASLPPPMYFDDAKRGLMKLEQWGDELWLFYKHPDGQWVSLRKATDEDLDKLDMKVRAQP